MSRYRSSTDDLAYGDGIPQRWDRERFERFGRQGEDDYRFTERERERPGRRDVAVAERRESSRFERDRMPSRTRRRTDKELFGEVDPREIADMALTPYKRTSVTREDFDIDLRSRPGLLRRQSSLDTFDRRPARYEREEYRIPPYTPVPLPIRRRRDEREDPRYRDDDLEDYREVEIQRERSVHRRRPAKSERSVKEEKVSYHHHSHHSDTSSSSSSSVDEEIDVKSTKARSARAPSTRAPSIKAKSTRAPSVHESFHETIIEESAPPAPSLHESFHETAFEESVREERRFKKGKTRMPKRLVRREAVMDLGYPFDEEDDFFVLRIALEKEQIDEVIQISETYKDGEKKKVYRFDEKIVEEEAPVGEYQEIERTEWINPPTVIGSKSQRTSASRAPSAPPPPPVPVFYEESKTIIEERAPSHHPGTMIIAEREHRDINAEIRSLEAERQALRYEREADEKRDLALRLRARPEEEYQLVDYRSRSRPREELVLYEREKSPERNVLRIEKDKKGRMAFVRSTH